MQQSLSSTQNALAVGLLPEPPQRQTRGERELERLYRRYALAFAAATAIDHPHSRYVDWSEEQKAPLRIERAEALRQVEAAYLDLLARTQRNAQRRAKAREASRARHKPLAPEQKKLFADAWPDSHAWVADRFPMRPFVSDELEHGTVIRPLDHAVRYRYVQYDPPSHTHLLVFDVDRSGAATAWRDATLPPPTWIATNPDNAHAHLVYALRAPVCTSDAARQKPLAYLAAIEHAYTVALGADPGFSGVLTKNPVHEGQSWLIEWVTPEPYDMRDLAQHVELLSPWDMQALQKARKTLADVKLSSLGRKMATFEHVRHWSYRAVSAYWDLGFDAWTEAVRNAVSDVNENFNPALPESHQRAIAKSIAKWVWARFTPSSKAALVANTHTPAVQALHGRQKGAKKREQSMTEALQRLAAGESLRSIAQSLGVTAPTILNWKKRSETPAKPVQGLQ